MKLISRRTDAHTLIGAYAMDAITARDRERFERHLAGCEECAREIAGLREATAMLGAATARPLPAGLKERVMTAAEVTRQQPPAEEQAARTGTRAAPRDITGTWFRSLAWPGRLTLAAGTAAAAAVLAIAVVFGVTNGNMRQQLNQAQASSRQIAVVLTAQDAHMMTRAMPNGGTVRIVVSKTRHALVFTAKGLRPLPASQEYELWLTGPAGTRSIGMLPAGSDGVIGPVVVSGVRAGDHLALTDEPARGTARPTTPMMLDVAL
ncbi:MAG TPA: anti-sigma factor [Trebonia sp.]|jgi:anti-sigma factor RsiW|nr:anti-sigma factor [Trebonia sp.]